MNIEETIQKIIEKKNLSRDEIKTLIDNQIRDLSGLIDEEGAIVIVAKELGIDIQEHQESANMEIDRLIKDLKLRMSASIVGRIIDIGESRNFNRKDGSKGSVLSFIIEDTSGMIRCVAWDHNSQILNEKGFDMNEIVRIVNGFVKLGKNGGNEVHIGTKSRIQIQPDKVKNEFIPPIKNKKNKFTPLDELNINLLSCNIKGNIISVFPSKTFNRSNGTKGIRSSLQLSDSTGSVYITFWGDHCEIMKNIEVGQKIQITKLTPKQNYRDKTKIDFTATSKTEIKIIEEKSKEPISTIKIKVLYEKGGFGNNIEGKIQEIDNIKTITLKSGDSKDLLKFVLADETGAIRVAVWGDKIIKSLKVNDVLFLKGVNAKINPYNNEMEASLSAIGSIEISEKVIKTDKTLEPTRKKDDSFIKERKRIEEIDQASFYEFKGSIIQEIKQINIYTACSKCNRKVDNCRCDIPGENVNRMILNLILDDESSTIRATLMGEKAELLLNENTDRIKEIKESGDIEEFLKKKNFELIGKEFIFRGKARFSDYSDSYEISINYFEELNPEKEAQRIADLLNEV